MTVLAIVAYPALEQADQRWVESIRAQHDPQARRLGAHFTLVFPVEATATDLEGEVAAVTRTQRPIPFEISRAEAVSDAFGSGWRVFLVPDEGRQAITELHRRLYEGVLRPHLSDVPYVPHVTVAASGNAEPCRRLAQDLNSRGRVVRGRLETINLLKIEPDRVQSLAAYVLR